jgi:hypothetical protein
MQRRDRHPEHLGNLFLSKQTNNADPQRPLRPSRDRAGLGLLADRNAAFAANLCIQEERVVGNDNTVRYRGLSLQLPESPLRPHFVKARVRVHDYPDGTLAVFHGPHRRARYDGQGRLLDRAQSLAA